MSNSLIWIDCNGNARNAHGPIGTLVKGPIARGTSTVYMIATPCGTLFSDWKDTLVQRAPGAEVIHYSGRE